MKLFKVECQLKLFTFPSNKFSLIKAFERVSRLLREPMAPRSETRMKTKIKEAKYELKKVKLR